MKKLSLKQIRKFHDTVLNYYRISGRHDLPWRTNPSPYRVLVSEIMLQQTQVSRVLIKFAEFMRAFPNLKSLAQSDQHRLLSVWKGLGYNRRALWLRDAAQEIVRNYKGRIPHDPEKLEALKGVGHYTARAIAAFAYDMPHVFIETNIRRIYLHHFFKNKEGVHDNDLLPLIEQTLPSYLKAKSSQLTARHWYWALMDYGSHLAKTIPNPNRNSKHYTKQSKFEGSDRQIRGKILELLLSSSYTKKSLAKSLEISGEKLDGILATLDRDGFIVEKGSSVFIKT
ncbi:MAG: A/G-specific adenine glycosylase [Candidatus Pacebacteria bacterium]|nr:A/G-specific adenine glycosylase [Candidatus Paceibacterota bacterium]